MAVDQKYRLGWLYNANLGWYATDDVKQMFNDLFITA